MYRIAAVIAALALALASHAEAKATTVPLKGQAVGAACQEVRHTRRAVSTRRRRARAHAHDPPPATSPPPPPKKNTTLHTVPGLRQQLLHRRRLRGRRHGLHGHRQGEEGRVRELLQEAV